MFGFISSHFPGSLLISYLRQNRGIVQITETLALDTALPFFVALSVPEFRIVGVKGDVAFQRSSGQHRLRDYNLYGVLPEVWRFILIHDRHCHCSSAHRQVGSLVAQRLDVFHRQKQHVPVLRFKIQRLQGRRQAGNLSVTLRSDGNEMCAGKFLKIQNIYPPT